MLTKLGILAVSLWFLTLGSSPVDASVSSESLSLKVKADQLLKRGRIEQAIPMYESVLQRDRTFANAYYNLSTAYFLQGNLEKAVSSLEAFVKLEPKDGEALYNLGCLKLRLGAFDEARKCFLRAEDCPSTGMISQKIKEALQFVKDLSHQNPETQKLLAYVLSGSSQTLFAA